MFHECVVFLFCCYVFYWKDFCMLVDCWVSGFDCLFDKF